MITAGGNHRRTIAKYRRAIAGLVIVSILAFIAGGLVAPWSRIKAAGQIPVWGRKPVLAYFALTVDLSSLLKAEAGLSDAQFEIVRQAALEEQAQLRALAETWQAALESETARAPEAAALYNQQAADQVSSTDQKLRQALDEATYQKVVDWINARWPVERALHGSSATTLAPDGTARSYTVMATYFDTSGSRMVALPDKCIKFANLGTQKCSSGYAYNQNYSVKLSYNGKTTTVPVLDVGPWNTDDNYWATTSDPQPRRMFTDLALGMPEAQAAYFNDYNGGLDQTGRVVTAPFAIDLAYAVAPDLGLTPGQNVWMSVTFLWTSTWPAVDPVTTVTLNTPTKLTPPYSSDLCASAWYKITGYSGSPAYLTLNVNNASQSTNSGEWATTLGASGRYRVDAYIPDHGVINWTCQNTTINSDTTQARYTITHSGGDSTVTINQAPLTNQWVSLGTYNFTIGQQARVRLTDLNNEANLSHTVSFSAMRFVPLDNPPPTSTNTPTPTLTPTPSPTPTPTPTPQPLLWAPAYVVEAGENITVPIKIQNINQAGLGEAQIQVQYDPAVVELNSCQADPFNLFDNQNCEPFFEHDGANPDTAQFRVISTLGVTGGFNIAWVVFRALGLPGSAIFIHLLPLKFTNPAGAPLPVTVGQGMICIAPCKSILYFPLAAR